MFFKLLARILPRHIVYAHCDVPCGIYDPKPAQIAAATVLKMVQKIFPNLHEIFWNAAKLCSKNKQSVDEKAAYELVKTVNEIADMFQKSKSLK